jgi:hypothetical protein
MSVYIASVYVYVVFICVPFHCLKGMLNGVDLSYNMLCICICISTAPEFIHHETKEQGGLAQMAWHFINDSFKSTLCLQYNPAVICVGVIALSIKFRQRDGSLQAPTKKNSSSSSQLAWYEELFGVSKFTIDAIANEIIWVLEFAQAQASGDFTALTQPPPMKAATITATVPVSPLTAANPSSNLDATVGASSTAQAAVAVKSTSAQITIPQPAPQQQQQRAPIQINAHGNVSSLNAGAGAMHPPTQQPHLHLANMDMNQRNLKRPRTFVSKPHPVGTAAAAAAALHPQQQQHHVAKTDDHFADSFAPMKAVHKRPSITHTHSSTPNKQQHLVYQPRRHSKDFVEHHVNEQKTSAPESTNISRTSSTVSAISLTNSASSYDMLDRMMADEAEASNSSPSHNGDYVSDDDRSSTSSIRRRRINSFNSSNSGYGYGDFHTRNYSASTRKYSHDSMSDNSQQRTPPPTIITAHHEVESLYLKKGEVLLHSDDKALHAYPTEKEGDFGVKEEKESGEI